MKSWSRAKLWVIFGALGLGLLLFGLSSCGNSAPPGGNGGGGGSGGGGGGSPGFSMALNPSQLSATAGGSATTTLTITPQNGFSGTVKLSLVQQDGSPAPSGLTLSPTQVSVSGTTSKTLQISVGSGVAPATYRLRLVGRSGSLKAHANFSLTVTAAKPRWRVNPSTLTFSGTVGGEAPGSQEFTLENAGDATGNFTISADMLWIHPVPSSGGLGPGESARISVSVDACTTAGTDTGHITVSGGGSQATVTVTRQCSGTTAEQLIWEDDFESDAVGSFPANWHVVYSGAGESEQYVTDAQAFSGTHSFRVLGNTGWSAVIARNIPRPLPDVLGVEYSIYINGRASDYIDHPGFVCETCGDWSQYWGLSFDHKSGEIRLGTRDGTLVLGTWQPQTWIRVKYVLNRRHNTVSVWINGIQKAFDEPLPDGAQNTDDIQGFAVVSAWPAQEVFYDKIRIFSLESSGGNSAIAEWNFDQCDGTDASGNGYDLIGDFTDRCLPGVSGNAATVVALNPEIPCLGIPKIAELGSAQHLVIDFWFRFRDISSWSNADWASHGTALFSFGQGDTQGEPYFALFEYPESDFSKVHLYLDFEDTAYGQGHSGVRNQTPDYVIADENFHHAVINIDRQTATASLYIDGNHIGDIQITDDFDLLGNEPGYLGAHAWWGGINSCSSSSTGPRAIIDLDEFLIRH